MDPWKRRFLLETMISRFHVNFWGCNPSVSQCFAWKSGRMRRGKQQRVDTEVGDESWDRTYRVDVDYHTANEQVFFWDVWEHLRWWRVYFLSVGVQEPVIKRESNQQRSHMLGHFLHFTSSNWFWFWSWSPGWPKLDTVKLILDMNTAEHGYAIRSIQVDLSENCPEFSLLKFVHLGADEVQFGQTTKNLNEYPGSMG